MKRRRDLVVGFWSKSEKKSIVGRLKLNSEAYVLWNYFFIEKKKSMHDTIIEMIRMARERVNDNRHNESFLLSMVQEYDSQQKAYNRIFDLAVERYHEIQSQGQGQMPVILPHRVPAPRIEETKEKRTVERKKHIAPQPEKPLEKIQKAFPQNLTHLLTFEIEGRNTIIKKKSPKYMKEWTDVMMIVNNLKGKWNRERQVWIIPLE